MTYKQVIQNAVAELNRRECIEVDLNSLEHYEVEGELCELFSVYLGEQEAEDLKQDFARAYMTEKVSEICESSPLKMQGFSMRNLGARLVASLSL